ncbi:MULTISPECIES: hypothetical protein [unclassified Saccharicrinis]|uniref:hypothetical protein n=1 Tax=unclassified Saccharicrinis TaxID=2646859 RepID=UPI003D358F91
MEKYKESMGKGDWGKSENRTYLNLRFKWMRNLKAAVIIGVVLVCGNTLSAQEVENAYKPFQGYLSLRNMHMWRGFVVTPGVMTSTALEYNDRSGKLTLGLWGGASFDGTFKEYSYYGVYRFADNFYVEVVSHNNYSSQDEEDIDMFSYAKETSPNFVDIALGYTVSEEVPLTLFWATILAGQGQDYEVDENGDRTDSYSNYVEAKYRLHNKGGYQLSAFAGGAFSFSTEKTFYSKGANFVNIGLTLSKSVEVFNKKIPVNFNGIWNPESGKGVLQIDVVLF